MRYVIDFGSANAGGAPVFLQFKRLDTLQALTPPAFVPLTGGQFAIDYEAPSGVPCVAYKASCGGVTPAGLLPDPAPGLARYLLDFGTLTGATVSFAPADGGLFVDANTAAALTPPGVIEIGSGLYYFAIDWATVGARSVAYRATVAASGIELSGVLTDNRKKRGESSLWELREKVRQRTDTENDPHISDGELTGWISDSYSELYDILVTRFGEDYYSANASITTDGSETYPLPDGVLYGAAPAYYKGALVELAVPGPQKWATLHRFPLGEKNRYALPQYVTTAGLVNLRYRLSGSSLLLAPTPTSGQTIRLWYAPRPAMLTDDADLADGVSGWLDYVVADACVKVCGKQERDPSLFLAQKAGLKERIEAAAQNRDPGEPSTVTLTEADDFGGGFPGAFPWSMR